MSESLNEQPQSPAPAPNPQRRGFLTIAGIAVAAAVTGAVATTAVGAAGFGPGFGHGFGPPWHGGMMGRLDPAQAEDLADRGVRHLAIEIDATNEQQDKLRAITKSLVDDLIPLRDKAQAARNQVRTLLTQPKIDRDAIEKFRSEQIALADTTSKRLAQGLADAADVLTPDQRQKLNERIEQFRDGPRGYWRPWHRG